MPRNRKCLINNAVVEVGFRMEQGLPLTDSVLIQHVLNGILAAGQTLYPVKLCHFIVMGNHVHMILVVVSPEDFYQFVGYFKRESAHVINRLLGRRKRTVWCEGYDSPIILDAEKVISRIAYLYCNPVEAKLCSSVGLYKGLSSWRAFQTGGSLEFHRRVRRNAVSEVADMLNSELEQIDAVWNDLSCSPKPLLIEPNAWMQCFESSRSVDPKLVYGQIESLIRLKEVAAVSSVGSARTHRRSRNERLDMAFLPRKWGKRSICLASDGSLRAAFLSWYRNMAGLAAESIALVRRGIAAAVPPGFFRPGGLLQSGIAPAGSPLPLA